MNYCFQYIHCLLDQVDIRLRTHVTDPEYFPGQFTIIASHDHTLHSQFRIQTFPSHVFRHVNRSHRRGTHGSFHGVYLQSHLFNPFTAVSSHLLVPGNATLPPFLANSLASLMQLGCSLPVGRVREIPGFGYIPERQQGLVSSVIHLRHDLPCLFTHGKE